MHIADIELKIPYCITNFLINCFLHCFLKGSDKRLFDFHFLLPLDCLNLTH